MNKNGILILVLFLINTGMYAQVNSCKLEQFLENYTRLKSIVLKYPGEVKNFYKLRDFRPVWIGGYYSRVQELSKALQQSPDLGLEIKNYQPDIIQSFLNNNATFENAEDSLAAEVTLTAAAIHFLHDVIYGNSTPVLDYNGLNYSPACFDIPSLLLTIIDNNELFLLHEPVESKNTGYLSIKKLIKKYNTIIAGNGFKEVNIRSSKTDSSNKPLLKKLYQLGITDSANQKLSSEEIKKKVTEAQQLFNLLADGMLRSTTLEAMNIPLGTRLKELKQALNTMRWLSCIKTLQKIIVVNIPSANLLVYDRDTVILESRIIDGKRSTPTPTLCSKVTEVILYPYWMVPYSIATKELLPSIKRSIGTVNAGNYQVINLQGRVVDPYKIDWGSLSSSDFPYIIRQSTGCDNALGLVKLNFYNPYSVYLHDTPDKNLFSLNKRYFSHGCMRVEKAMKLARLVLKKNFVAIDTLEEKGCLYNQSPVSVPADEIIPVFVLYNTAWTDSSGKVSFHEDIYRKNNIPKRKN